MRKGIAIRRAVSVTLLLLIVAVTGVYLSKHAVSLRSGLNFSLGGVILLSVLNIAFIGINGLRIRVLAGVFSVRLRLPEWLGLSATNSLLNYLPGQGGMVARGVYLRQVHGLSVALFASTVAGSLIITTLTLSVLGLIAILALQLARGLFSLELAVFLTILIAGGFVAMTARFPKTGKEPARQSVAAWMESAWQGWTIIRGSSGTVLRLVTLDVVAGLIYAGRLLVSFHMVSAGVPYLQALALTPLALLSSVIALTPGALGIREAVIGWEVTLFGSSAASGVQAAAIDRVISLLWTAALGAVFSFYLPALLRHSEDETEQDL